MSAVPPGDVGPADGGRVDLDPADLDPVVVTVGQGMAAGGDALGRLADGLVVLVEGALPGETVEVAITTSRRDHAKARVTEFRDVAASRIEPTCPHRRAGCGGCGWAHVRPDDQLDLAGRIVADALRRIGHRREPPPMRPARRVDERGYRTTVTMAPTESGVLAYHRHHDQALIAVDDCQVAHPRISELINAVTAPGWGAVTLRTGIAGGERLVIVDPSPRSARRRSPGRRDRRGRPDESRSRRPDGGAGHVDAAGGGGRIDVPAGAVIVRPGDDAVVHEDVGGRRWQISARSFFQSGPQGAELLVAAVDAAVGDVLSPGDHLVDAYAGVGLLGGIIAERHQARLTAVESDPSAVADAGVNLRGLDATIVASEVGRWDPPTASVVIADPARPGLGRPGVRTVVATGARRIVLVSCDPASLARDTALLAEAGYRLATLEVVGMFPDTVHVETVARFDAPSAF